MFLNCPSLLFLFVFSLHHWSNVMFIQLSLSFHYLFFPLWTYPSTHSWNVMTRTARSIQGTGALRFSTRVRWYDLFWVCFCFYVCWLPRALLRVLSIMSAPLSTVAHWLDLPRMKLKLSHWYSWYCFKGETNVLSCC